MTVAEFMARYDRELPGAFEHPVPLRCGQEGCWEPTAMYSELCQAHKGSVGRPRQLVCRRGHPMVSENLYVQSKTGKRECRQCRRDSHKPNRRAA